MMAGDQWINNTSGKKDQRTSLSPSLQQQQDEDVVQFSFQHTLIVEMAPS